LQRLTREFAATIASAKSRPDMRTARSCAADAKVKVCKPATRHPGTPAPRNEAQVSHLTPAFVEKLCVHPRREARASSQMTLIAF